jgi:hypothetical protein
MMDLVTIESCAAFRTPVSLAEFAWRHLDRIREQHAIGPVEALDGGRSPGGVASPVDPLPRSRRRKFLPAPGQTLGGNVAVASANAVIGRSGPSDRFRLHDYPPHDLPRFH